MFLSSMLLALSSVRSLAIAADPQIIFTSTLPTVVAGQTYNLTWSGGDGVSPVAIELRRGDSANLIWVAYLTTDATDGSYLWTVSPDLPNATDYALQIFEMMNVTNINYSARFSLSGSTSAPAATPTQAVGIAGTGSSIGTGTALPRNTTFVAPTLTSLATCSGLNGICAGTAVPTSTTKLVATDVRTSIHSASATLITTDQAMRLSSSLEHALVPVVVVILAML